jgi:Tol biopolymer transport system component
MDLSRGCGHDFVTIEFELMSLNLNDFSADSVYSWPFYRGEYSISFNRKVYGVSPDGSEIFFTEDHTRDSATVFRLNVNSGEKEKIEVDSYGFNFSLSPNSNYMAYQNNGVWIYSFTENESYKLPLVNGNVIPIRPEWYLGEKELIVSGSGGMWRYSLSDSSYVKINDSGYGTYSLSADGSKIAIQISEALQPSRVAYKPLTFGEVIILDEGTSPRFVNNDQAIVYEQLYGIYISTLTGTTNKIFDKTGGGDRSRTGSFAVSPDGNKMAFADREMLYLYDTVNERISFSKPLSELLPVDPGNWASIDYRIHQIRFTPDNQKMFFMVDIKKYDDGC